MPTATFSRVNGLAALDWTLLAAYGAVVIGIGAWANRRQKSAEDYTLGGRRMAWWAVGVSLIATSFSSAALIGGTGFGFQRGMSYLSLQMGDLLAIAGACVLFIPFFSRLRLTTAYEYLERRFGVVARCVASALFIAQTVLRAGILVYGPALALSVILGWDVEVAIVVTGAAAVVYSATGGLAAVVWTDLIQFTVVVVGVTASVLLLGGDVPGGLGAVLERASAEGHLRVVEPGYALGTPFNALGALVAYGTLAFSIAATNQQAVQRYLSCKDGRAATKAALLGWGIGFVAVALTLFLGACLSVWVESAGDAGAAVAAAVEQNGGDAALPAFIVQRLPAGLSGLLVAAIFSASMSSMDSAIHSMSTATLVDFVRRFSRRPRSDAQDLRLARLLTVVFGVVATVAGVVAAAEDSLLLDLLIRWLGYFAGPLLGLFLLAALSRRANEKGALVGVAVAGAGVIFAANFEWPAWCGHHPLWLAPLSCAVTCVVGRLASACFPPPTAEQLDGLTWWTRPPHSHPRVRGSRRARSRPHPPHG